MTWAKPLRTSTCSLTTRTRSFVLDARRMQQDLHGERVPLVELPDRQSDLPFTQPILISVHVPGNGSRGTVLNLDSGANVPR